VPVPTLTAEQEEYYRTTAPEWRDVATDTNVIKNLKERLRKNCWTCYWFKDRMDGRDCMMQVWSLLNPDNTLTEIRLYSYQTRKTTVIREDVYEISGGILRIPETYMDSLSDGYYDVTIEFYDSEREINSNTNQTYYIAQSDPYQGDVGWWLLWSQLDYKEGYDVSFVVRPDSMKNILKLIWANNRKEVDESLYEIMYDGQAIRLSTKLLQVCMTTNQNEFYVCSTDGTETRVRINFLETTVTVTPTPTPTPTLSLTSDMEEYCRTTAPEWRDDPNDSDAIIAIKQRYRDGLFLDYYFKNRMVNKECLLQLAFLRNPQYELEYITIYSYQTQEQMIIDPQHYEIDGDIVRISAAYMNSLPDGYYRMVGECSLGGYSNEIYIVQNDVYEKTEYWLFSKGSYDVGDEYISVIVSPASKKVVSKLSWYDGSEIDESLYEILYNGRAIRFSLKLLEQCVASNKWHFYAYCTDGSKQEFWVGHK